MPPLPQQLRTVLLLAAVVALAACSTASGPDPWRRTNEKVFRFNEGFDKRFLEPVAGGWDAVAPGFFQRMIANFFVNLTVPRTLVNDMLQGRAVELHQDFFRLAVNTTFGIAGLFDVASATGIPKHEEDFGQTLGRWGAGAGPYVVLPLAGPHNVRDLVAAPFDVATNPTTWVNVFGASIVRVVNTRARYLEEIDQAREDAVDYYVFVRDAYLSRRERAVRDGAAAAATDDDLYDVDELDQEGAETPDAQP